MLPAATLSATVWPRVELDRIEEALDEADLVVGEGRVEPVDGLGQHRVAEAVDHVGELGDDARIDVGVVAVRHDEEVDVGLDLAGEILEHEMLVLHLGAELGGLEQALAVPDQRIGQGMDPRRVGRDGVDLGLGQIDIQPLVDEGHVLGREHDLLGVLDQPVVLGVEDVVDGGQADVLVGAAVAGDEVGVEQFVVVDRRAVAGVEQADFDVAVGDAVRDRVMGDVGQEGGVDAERGWQRRPARPRCRR